MRLKSMPFAATLALTTALALSGCKSSTPATPAPGASPDSTATQPAAQPATARSEEHTSELQSRQYLVCRLLLEKKKKSASATLPAQLRCAARKRAMWYTSTGGVAGKQ